MTGWGYAELFGIPPPAPPIEGSIADEPVLTPPSLGFLPAFDPGLP